MSRSATKSRTVRTDRKPVNDVELTGPFSPLPELREVVPLGVDNDHARVVVAVRHQNPPVGQERHVLGFPEVGLVVAGDIFLPERHQELATVIGEHENLMHRLMNDPHPALGIVGADANPVRPGPIRPFEQVVPLVPSSITFP